MSKSSIINSFISIIIPCYNHGQYILDAIESVKRCNSRLYELIIVNDGSTDPYTLTVLRNLEDKGYKVINQRNSGLGAARNAGIKEAAGDFILPLDSDNKIYPEYLLKSLEVFNKFPNVAVVYGKKEFFGDTKDNNTAQAREFNLLELVLDNYIDACAVIRKSAVIELGGFSTEFPHQGIEDWDLWISLARKNWDFYFLDKIVYSYRIRPDSMTSNMTRTENRKENLSFFYAKHALFLRELLSRQYQEIQERKSFIPYSIRILYRKLRYGRQRNLFQ